MHDAGTMGLFERVGNFDRDLQRLVGGERLAGEVRGQRFAQPLGFESITAIPLSALKGMNITERSAATPWYTGPTLIGYLETVKVVPAVSDRLVFPVQWVNRPNSDFRGFAGTIMQGGVRQGDEIRVTRSGHTATVSAIVTMDGERTSASQGHAVTLTLDPDGGWVELPTGCPDGSVKVLLMVLS